MAGVSLEQLTLPEAVEAVAEAREAARRGRRACHDMQCGEGKDQEAEEEVHDVGPCVGEEHAVPRPVHGELHQIADMALGFTLVGFTAVVHATSRKRREAAASGRLLCRAENAYTKITYP